MGRSIIPPPSGMNRCGRLKREPRDAGIGRRYSLPSRLAGLLARDEALSMEPDLTRWNQRLAHALVEISPDAFVAIAEDTRVLFRNQGAHGLFGYTSEEATG